jgi:predicted amidohydrolase
MSTLRVALAQILSVADPEENLELVATRTAEAARQEAQLVVFPEATMRRSTPSPRSQNRSTGRGRTDCARSPSTISS